MDSHFKCTYRSDGTQEYFNEDGERHRIGGPAIVYPSGSEEWWVDGMRHREGGPAVVNVCGYQAWYRWGDPHNTRGPALVHACGYYHVCGICHPNRTKTYAKPRIQWYIQGHRLAEKEFYRYVDTATGEIFLPHGRALTHTTTKHVCIVWGLG